MHNYNLILTGAPGTGKTYLAREIAKEITSSGKDGEFEFVQFHPSYDYTDFVEGLRPIKKDGSLGFEHKNGIFKNFCISAKKNPKEKYIFIIDEINRGELNKIFGELFYAIDDGYRGDKGAVITQYANIDEGESMMENNGSKQFYVPENVYIIGTMNDIDRSVESFDFAIRRRFTWMHISPNDTFDMMFKDSRVAAYKDEAHKKMTALNKAITAMEDLGDQYCIGGAYFLKITRYKGDFQALWKNHLELLLKEYLRGSVGGNEKLGTLQTAYDTGQSSVSADE